MNTISVSNARGNETEALRFKAIERGMARRVPTVPEAQGEYPVPAPVAKNKIIVLSLKIRRPDSIMLFSH
jgi:hypothetical protein